MMPSVHVNGQATAAQAFNIRLAEPQESHVSMLVLMIAPADGTKDLIAVEMGLRASEQSWTNMIVELKHVDC